MGLGCSSLQQGADLVLTSSASLKSAHFIPCTRPLTTTDPSA